MRPSCVFARFPRRSSSLVVLSILLGCSSMHMRQAMNWESRDNLQQALHTYEQAISEDPGNIKAYTRAIYCAVYLENADALMRVSTALNKRAPKSPMAYAGRGAGLYFQGELEESERLLRDAIGKENDHPLANMMLARILADRQDIQNCILHFNRGSNKAHLIRDRTGMIPRSIALAHDKIRQHCAESQAEVKAALKAGRAEALRRKNEAEDAKRRKEREEKIRNTPAQTGHIQKVMSRIVANLSTAGYTEHDPGENSKKAWVEDFNDEVSHSLYGTATCARFMYKVTPSTPSRETSIEFVVMIPAVVDEIETLRKNAARPMGWEVALVILIDQAYKTSLSFFFNRLPEGLKKYRGFDRMTVVVFNAGKQGAECKFGALGAINLLSSWKTLGLTIDGQPTRTQPWTRAGIELAKTFLSKGFALK
ncbi:MAG: tetratricopeptide repeat protein, partial [Planctomycetota bacterium]